MKVEQGFQQPPFDLGDPWGRDPAFRAVVHRLMSGSPLAGADLDARLERFSARIVDKARPWTQTQYCAEPVLVTHDNWGRRVDRLETSEGWRQLEHWSLSQGMIGEAYGKAFQEQYLGQQRYDSAGGREALDGRARLYAFARTYMFSPDSRVNVCPTSMQDGAVRTLELYGTPEQRALYMPRLLSRERATAFVAGQWMTEKPGGSDVAQTETRAVRLENLASGNKSEAGKPGDLYLLDGFKWFSSCPDGDLSLALARTSGAGSAGLSLFIVPVKKSNILRPIPAHLRGLIPDNNPHNDYNGIRVHRLKKKLGTELVPTAELELDGAVGELVGKEGRGVFYIASVLNLTRLYSASGSCAAIGTALNIATDYAGRRRVEATKAAPTGTLLCDIPMHVERLARVNVTHRALLQLVFGTIALLSVSEAGRASQQQEVLLRLLTPVAKAFAALRGTEAYVQCIESLGGQGYMLENGLADVLKSATVERIWEGTPSVLAHDVKRVLTKTHGLALGIWLVHARQALHKAAAAGGAAQDARGVADALVRALDAVQGAFFDELDLEKASGALSPLAHDGRASRALLELIGIVQCGIGLLEQAAWARANAKTSPHAQPDQDLEAARRWTLGAEGGLPEALRELADVEAAVRANATKQAEQANRALVFAGRTGAAAIGTGASANASKSDVPAPAQGRSSPAAPVSISAKSRL